MRPFMHRLARWMTATCLLASANTALAAGPEPIEKELFDSWVGKYPDMTTEALNKHLGIGPVADKAISFSVTKSKFYDHVVKAMALSPAARATLAKNGLVIVPQAPAYSMAAALYKIYTSDMPLLVTTDSVLDAMHRSFDAILADLEETVLRNTVKDALFAAQMKLVELAKKEPALTEAATDCDLYLSVALNLLDMEPGHDRLLMANRLAPTADVMAILKKVDALKLENPDVNGLSTTIYGERRAVDYSQFKPRGHYDTSIGLSRYFRAMMWLGRADTGFEVEMPRQLRAAAVLTRVFDESGASAKLKVVRDVVELMVGRSDNLGPQELAGLLRSEKLSGAGALVGPGPMKKLADAISASGLAAQRIRSQLVVSMPSDTKKVDPPALFQLFGQGFILDSFVLSKVVYDDILFKGQKQERRMPTGLDVMAALGSDEAVRLLKGELDRWHYASNLATLRDVVGNYTDSHWNENLYTLWLDALRSLNKAPTGAGVPEVMQKESWAKKMTQTQLASWAQLRHDTILYAKQSDTASAGCVYPIGFVEPYVDFYSKVGRFASEASKRFKGLEKAGIPADRIARYLAYFDNFGATMTTLRGLAEKELAGKPFDKKDEQFLKNTIEKTDGPAGYFPTPDWTGWYVKLVFNRGSVIDDVIEIKPTVADVHTDPDTGTALEEGVGNVDFTVAAIDNHGDTAVYVGPTFSYYEFTRPASQRLTDPEWTQMVYDAAKLPARPTWLSDLIAK